MTSLDRITHPLRLAKGSHQPGSGKGCAMNVISYINGDTKITDYPACSARPLAKLVQMVNDRLADHDGYLSPENSVLVLDLGWQTVGTADVAPSVLHLWLVELLTNPKWGVVRHADERTRPIIAAVADLHRKLAADEPINTAEAWAAAARAAWALRAEAEAAAAEAATWASWAEAAAATRASWAEAAATRAEAWAAATRAAARAAEAAEARAAAGLIEFARNAITCWRDLAGLDKPAEINPAEVDSALARIGV